MLMQYCAPSVIINGKFTVYCLCALLLQSTLYSIMSLAISLSLSVCHCLDRCEKTSEHCAPHNRWYSCDILRQNVVAEFHLQ